MTSGWVLKAAQGGHFSQTSNTFMTSTNRCSTLRPPLGCNDFQQKKSSAVDTWFGSRDQIGQRRIQIPHDTHTGCEKSFIT